jgi:ubiquinone/menaquinone biosynthesis C-methylase UbiE
MKDRVTEERKFWDSFAEKYDGFIHKRASKSYDKLFKKLRIDTQNCNDLLEIATGTGLISIELSNQISNITAIDIAPKMIEIAKSKAKNHNITNINFQVGDSCNLDLESEYFDVVIASNVLHLLFAPEEAFQEMKRVLKNNGEIIIPTYCHGENIKTLMISRLMGLFGFRARNRWSIKSFKSFVEKNGFKIDESEVFKDKIPLIYIKASKI